MGAAERSRMHVGSPVASPSKEEGGPVPELGRWRMRAKQSSSGEHGGQGRGLSAKRAKDFFNLAMLEAKLTVIAKAQGHSWSD